MSNQKIKKRERRSRRAKSVIKKNSEYRLRLCVSRHNKHISCQIIDDKKGVTLVSASSLSKELKLTNGGNVDAATKVGALLAEKAKSLGFNELVSFDRNGNLYHGRVKALAEAARANGLKF
jgi:large subunit ribosomal protein L18